jgi:hypothetical protein
MAPRESASQQKSRHIRARNQQHRRDGAEEQVQGLLKIAADVIEQWSNLDAKRIAILRVLLREASLYLIHLRSRLRHANIRLEPSNYLDTSVSTFGCGTDRFLPRVPDGIDGGEARPPERCPETRRLAQVNGQRGSAGQNQKLVMRDIKDWINARLAVPVSNQASHAL